ncbi:UNVERIFIED_ORG: sigma 54 modulation/S30EA-like ribosomal protein [Anoxybacillus amylolyticus]
MNVHIDTKREDQAIRLREMVTEYFDPVARKMGDQMNIRVEESAFQYRVTIVVFRGKRVIKVQSRDKNIKRALYLVKQKLFKKIHSKKTFPFLNEPTKPCQRTEEILEYKRIDMKPMSIEEAILQMQTFNHHAFMFLRDDTQRMCMLYKRNNHQYVLLEAN